jgi:molybdate transport system ATP-binding protein
VSDVDNRIALRLRRGAFTLEVDLRLPARGITMIYGASGAGKTSLLRGVAGLERADHGYVRIGGAVWQDDANKVFVPVWQRLLGYVFQEASLFEHLDVRGNLEYGLRRTAHADRHKLDRAIDLLGIGALLGRRHDQLSGGERQRVAIARALATEPSLLLLDEPLAALDLPRRQEILPWLEKLRDEAHLPMLYVTHAADEVARLADHLIVLGGGRAVSAGPVAESLAAVDAPIMLGDDAGALLQATVVELDSRWNLARARFAGGELWLRDSGLAVGRSLRLRILARDVSVACEEPARSSIQNRLRGRIETIAPDRHPSQTLLRIDCGGIALLARVTRKSADELGLAVGMPVWALVKSVAVVS